MSDATKRQRYRCKAVTHCKLPSCNAPFRPWRKEQLCCSPSCGAALRNLKRPEQVKAWMAKATAASRANRVARLKKTLADCKTLGEAYRKGVAHGYSLGWHTHRRNNTA